jgi:Secretion system C-terminal sorting domain
MKIILSFFQKRIFYSLITFAGLSLFLKKLYKTSIPLLFILSVTLHTKAQCLKDITDTQPFTVTANNQIAGYPATDAFTNDDLAYNGWQTSINPEPASTCWIAARFTSGSQLVRGYSITSLDEGTTDKAPSDWLLEASNDGISWTTLDTRSSEVFFYPGETHIYSFVNSVSYNYYRINVSQTQNPITTLAISEIQFFADVCLQGTVFTDNGDRASAYNAVGDTPIPGVTVNIVTKPAGTVAASTITNVSGQYFFNAAQVPAAGSFSVIVTPPAGKIFVTQPSNIWSTSVTLPSVEEEPADGSFFFDYHLSDTYYPAATNRMLFAGGNIDFGMKAAKPPAPFVCLGNPGAPNLITIASNGTFGVTSAAWETIHPHQKGFAYGSNLLYAGMPAGYTNYTFNNIPTSNSGNLGVLLDEGLYNITSFAGTLSDISYMPYSSSLQNDVLGGWRKSYGITTADPYDQFLALNGATAGSLPFFKQTGLSLTAGDTYTLAFYGKHANSYAQVTQLSVTDAQIVVELLDNGNSVVSSGNLYLNPPTSYIDDRPESNWQLRMFSFTAPGGSGPFTVQLRASTTAAFGNDFYIDNVVLYACSLSLLPLQVVDFTARPSGILDAELHWTISNPLTATAEVQHSYDGKTFSNLSNVTLTADKTSYTFIHKLPGNAVHYYRLKINESKDRTMYSTVKTVDMHSNNSVLLYPNPVANEVHIQSANNLLQVSILDASGKCIKTQKDINRLQATVGCKDLAAGLYYIKVQANDGSSLHKIIVKH